MANLDSKAAAPVLTICPTSKDNVLAPLALASYLAHVAASSSTGVSLPVSLDWTHDALDEATLTIKPGGEKVSGVPNVFRQLITMYADTGVAGKDNADSEQVRVALARSRRSKRHKDH